jgi:hypothetical protein
MSLHNFDTSLNIGDLGGEAGATIYGRSHLARPT